MYILHFKSNIHLKKLLSIKSSIFYEPFGRLVITQVNIFKFYKKLLRGVKVLNFTTARSFFVLLNGIKNIFTEVYIVIV